MEPGLWAYHWISTTTYSQPKGQAYYDSIIELYASWGVDFIKCDDICNTDNLVEHSPGAYARKHEVEMLSRAIAKAGRPMVLSLSPGPAVAEPAHPG